MALFASLVSTFECIIFFDSEPELITKLYNNTHQAQTKVGQITDWYTHIIERTLDIYF